MGAGGGLAKTVWTGRAVATGALIKTFWRVWFINSLLLLLNSFINIRWSLLSIASFKDFLSLLYSLNISTNMTKTESVMNEPTPIPNILAGSVWEPLN